MGMQRSKDSSISINKELKRIDYRNIWSNNSGVFVYTNLAPTEYFFLNTSTLSCRNIESEL